MAKGHANERVLQAHYARRPQCPTQYYPLDPDRTKVQERKFLWWVAWYEYLLNLPRAPDAANGDT